MDRTLVIILVVITSVFCLNDTNISNDTDVGFSRDPKFFPFFGFVRFANTDCEASNNLTGTCYTRRQCARVPGVASGTCVRNIAVCCVVQRTCGDSSQANNTYFINPNFPSPFNGATKCTMTIVPCNSDICQLRLDFLSLSLAQPDGDGNCVDDSLTITGAGSNIPVICGENTGQQMYMDFNGATPIQIEIDTSADVSFSRFWNIQATQIACDCPNRAPSGCLQYYTGLSGTVKSFNFGTNENSANDNTGTREMANLDYGICVAMVPGYCSIQWSETPGNPYAFTVSGDTDGQAADILGTDTAALNDGNCLNDFVVIPDPIQNGEPVGTDRFCGNGFVTTTTFSKPFVLTVVTDADEQGLPPDLSNRGFCLDYQQIMC